MRIKANTLTPDRNLYESLRGRGYEAFMGQRGVGIILPCDDEGHHIPDGIGQFELVIEAEERIEIETGATIVVCGMSGKQLRPRKIFLPTKKQPNGVQARFSVVERCMSVRAALNGSIAMLEHTIAKVDGRTDLLKINARLCWSGAQNDLPTNLDRYAAAIRAAVQKLKCTDCRCVHFADLTERH